MGFLLPPSDLEIYSNNFEDFLLEIENTDILMHEYFYRV